MGGVAESASPSDFNTILTKSRRLDHTHTTNKQHNATMRQCDNATMRQFGNLKMILSLLPWKWLKDLKVRQIILYKLYILYI